MDDVWAQTYLHGCAAPKQKTTGPKPNVNSTMRGKKGLEIPCYLSGQLLKMDINIQGGGGGGAHGPKICERSVSTQSVRRGNLSSTDCTGFVYIHEPCSRGMCCPAQGLYACHSFLVVAHEASAGACRGTGVNWCIAVVPVQTSRIFTKVQPWWEGEDGHCWFKIRRQCTRSLNK